MLYVYSLRTWPIQYSSQLLVSRKSVGVSRFNSKKQQKNLTPKLSIYNCTKKLNSLRNEQASDFRLKTLDTAQMISCGILYQNELKTIYQFRSEKLQKLDLKKFG